MAEKEQKREEARNMTKQLIANVTAALNEVEAVKSNMTITKAEEHQRVYTSINLSVKEEDNYICAFSKPT